MSKGTRTASAPATEPDAKALLRSRRRFARRQWRRRWLAWKNVLAGVVVVGLLGAGVWAVWFSTLLSVQGVEVTGTAALQPQQVRRAAAVPLGEPLVSVDLSAVRNRIAALAAVESVDVSRQWPDQVLVEVTERTPIAVIEIGGKVRGLDRHGVVFQDYRRAPAGLPRVKTPAGTDIEALREAAEVVSAMPADVARIVDHVEVETVDRISLQLADGRTVVWGSADDSEQKAQVLQALLQHDAKTYDVSVPGQPTTSG